MHYFTDDTLTEFADNFSTLFTVINQKKLIVLGYLELKLNCDEKFKYKLLN